MNEYSIDYKILIKYYFLDRTEDGSLYKPIDEKKQFIIDQNTHPIFIIYCISQSNKLTSIMIERDRFIVYYKNIQKKELLKKIKNYINE